MREVCYSLFTVLQPPGIEPKKMEEEKRIDWERVNASLPYQRGEEQLEERRKLWRAIDVSGSGLLSLAKVYCRNEHLGKSMSHHGQLGTVSKTCRDLRA